jgi:copper resistance protein B
VKTILFAAAAALAFAAPAAAQPVPTPAPASTCTPEHAAMGHCTMPSQPQARQGNQTPSQGAQGSQSGQAMNHGQMSDCCRDADGNGEMDCCENMGAAVQSPTAPHAPAPKPQANQGH